MSAADGGAARDRPSILLYKTAHAKQKKETTTSDETRTEQNRTEQKGAF